MYGDDITMSKEELIEDCLGIYPFMDGYILHRSLEISRVDKDYNELWYFDGGDVFITRDEKNYPPVTVNGNNIEIYDWNNVFYLLDENGNLIQRLSPEHLIRGGQAKRKIYRKS